MAQEYVLTRLLPSGNEQILETIPVSEATQEEVIQGFRQQILDSARGRRLTAPAQRFIVYGPTEENTPRTPDDRIWDSLVDL